MDLTKGNRTMALSSRNPSFAYFCCRLEIIQRNECKLPSTFYEIKTFRKYYLILALT